MKKYRFPLQAVLREREIREDEKKRGLAKALDRLYAAKASLEKSRLEREMNLKGSLEEKMKSSPDVVRLKGFESFIWFLNQKISGQKNEVKLMEAEVMAERQKLIEASKRRKVMSTLKENRRVEYYLGMDKLEQKEMDESSVMRAKKTWET